VSRLLTSGAAIGRSLGQSSAFFIGLATVLLFAVSPALAPGSVSQTAIRGMLPFAAILAIAAVGQLLVVQQGGLDLSVPGAISLAVVIVTSYAGGHDGKLLAGMGIALAVVAVAGLLSGAVVSFFGVPPFVATLGVNALLLGAVLRITHGRSTQDVPSALLNFAAGRTWGIPNTVYCAAGVIAAMQFVQQKTILGRRFGAVGANAVAARAAGIRVQSYRLGTYVVASALYVVAAILLAGFLGVASQFPGDDYLLPTIAAVVLSGMALSGGKGSAFAVAIAALFLVQLQQVVLGLGAPRSVQLIVQGTVIALGMAVRFVPGVAVRHGQSPAAATRARTVRSSPQAALHKGGDR
jgi:ribose transport system permease protein